MLFHSVDAPIILGLDMTDLKSAKTAKPLKKGQTC
jgi:hypothetical protein